MANFAQTVNVIGAVKTTKVSAALETSALPLELFRHHFGSIGLSVRASSDAVDVVAALTKDRRNLTIAVVNPTEKWKCLQVKLVGARLNGKGEVYLIAHTDPEARNCPAYMKLQGASPDQVKIEMLPFLGVDLDSFPAPPLSVSLWRLGIGDGSMPKGIFEDIERPKKGDLLLCVYQVGNAFRAALSFDKGRSWRKRTDLLLQKALNTKDVQNFSLFAAEDGPYIVLSSKGRLKVVKINGNLLPSKVFSLNLSCLENELLEDPHIQYKKDSQTYVLLATTRRAGKKSVVAAESKTPESFPSPCPALTRKEGVSAGPVLGGALSVLFFLDHRLSTYRMSLAGRASGPYIVASAPLGSRGTSSAAAFVTSKEVVLFLKEGKKGWRTLKSKDLVAWEECGDGEFGLPEEKIERLSFLTVSKKFFSFKGAENKK